MPESIDDQIRQALAAAGRIAIYSHIRPDGDAIGSTVALGHILAHLGKDF